MVGWWATWPAEPVRGAMVSDHFAYHFLFDASKADDPTGKTYPPELTNRLAPLARRPASLKPEDVAPFIHVSKEELARPFHILMKGSIVQALTYSHDVLPLWNGHVVLIVQQRKTVTLTQPPGPGQFLVLGDALVELDEEWNPVFAQLQLNLGTSWDSYRRAVAEDATLLPADPRGAVKAVSVEVWAESPDANPR